MPVLLTVPPSTGLLIPSDNKSRHCLNLDKNLDICLDFTVKATNLDNQQMNSSHIDMKPLPVETKVCTKAYQFDVSLHIRGCGTTSVAHTRKTVIATSEKEAREKLKKGIEVEVGSITLKKHFFIK